MSSPQTATVVARQGGKRTPTATDHMVGAQIRSLRRAAGKTLRQLGDEVGVSCVQFFRYETGASRVAASRLFAIGHALGVSVDSLNGQPAQEDTSPQSRQRSSERADLLRMFDSISDAKHRLAILTLTRSIAEREKHDGEVVYATPDPMLSVNTLGPLNHLDDTTFGTR